MGRPGRERLVTRRFALVVGAGLAYFTAMGMLLPVVPVYVDKRLDGGGLAVGVAVGALFVSAVLFRPLAGRVGDRFGRRVLLVGGAAIVGVSMALYASAESFPVLIVARLLTGVGEAAFFVGGATMVTDLAPIARRGEAISYWSVGVFGGLAFGPILGEAVLDGSHYVNVWLVAAALAGVASLLALGTRDVERDPEAPVHAKLINRKAVGPGALLFLGLIPLAAFSSFVPLYVDDVGLHGADGIFALYGVLILLVRIFGARIPDRFGGGTTGAAALLANATGMAIIVAWSSQAGLIVGTIVFSAGMSLLYPAFFLLALHGVAESERGSAVGTVSVFFDLSQGLGAVIVGGVAAVTDIQGAFAAGGCAALLGFAAMRVLRGRLGRVAPAPA
jgi:MFS family permease